MPTTAAGDAQRNAIFTRRFRTELCASFVATGRCKYHNRCMFAHGPELLRTPEQNVADGLTCESAIRQWSKTHKPEGKMSDSHHAPITTATATATTGRSPTSATVSPLPPPASTIESPVLSETAAGFGFSHGCLQAAVSDADISEGYPHHEDLDEHSSGDEMHHHLHDLQASPIALAMSRASRQSSHYHLEVADVPSPPNGLIVATSAAVGSVAASPDPLVASYVRRWRYNPYSTCRVRVETDFQSPPSSDHHHHFSRHPPVAVALGSPLLPVATTSGR